MPGSGIVRVDDEDRDFYGRRYWFEYQERELGNPDITVRARSDLPERCLYWLRTVLRYRLPPRSRAGRRLRPRWIRDAPGTRGLRFGRFGAKPVGCGLCAADLWRTRHARATRGTILRAGKRRVITMMDVLEHVPEPLTTLGAACALLDEQGILVIQTPVVPLDLSWEAMVAADHPFLPLMRERGHLYLFGETSLRRLLARLEVPHVVFEPAYFGAYDMFVVASRRPLAANVPAAVANALTVSPDGRLAQALLDLDDCLRDLQARYFEAERDRAARLTALHEHGARLKATEGERNSLCAELQNLKGHLMVLEEARAEYVSVLSERDARLGESEADRAARLAVIQEQGGRLGVMEHELGEIRRRLDEVELDRAALRRHLDEVELDRAARLAVIEEQAAKLAASEADRAARLAVIQEQGGRLGVMEHELGELRRHLDEVELDRAALRRHLDEVELDRAARLAVIEEQAAKLAASEADRAARLAVIEEQGGRLGVMEHELGELRRRLDEVELDRAALAAELAALRFRDVRARVRTAMRRVRAGSAYS